MPLKPNKVVAPKPDIIDLMALVDDRKKPEGKKRRKRLFGAIKDIRDTLRQHIIY